VHAGIRQEDAPVVEPSTTMTASELITALRLARDVDAERGRTSATSEVVDALLDKKPASLRIATAE